MTDRRDWPHPAPFPPRPAATPPAPAGADAHAPHGPEGHRRRLMDRFRACGAEALADHELLEMLLFFVIPKRDTKPLAKELLRRCDGWTGLLAADAPVRTVRGAGPATELFLRAIGAVVERRLKRGTPSLREGIASVADVVRYLGARMHGLSHERFHVLYLNQANRILHEEQLSLGTEDHAPVHPRQVIKGALTHHATGIIVAHNHPAGTLQPSAADREITRALAAAAQALDLRLLDHLILAANGVGYFSFREQGLL